MGYDYRSYDPRAHPPRQEIESRPEVDQLNVHGSPKFTANYNFGDSSEPRKFSEAEERNVIENSAKSELNFEDEEGVKKRKRSNNDDDEDYKES